VFKLDPRLSSDTLQIASWPLCEVLLMNDSHFPWLILVPKISGATELYHLTKNQRIQLDAESIFLSETLMKLYQGTRLNVAALGNVVSQLHIHHVVRFQTDSAWPAPVWGKFAAKPYEEDALNQQIKMLAPIIEHKFLSACV